MPPTMPLLLLLFLMLILVMPCCSLADSCPELQAWRRVEKVEHMNFSSGLLQARPSLSFSACAALCHRQAACCAFSHSQNTRRCGLHNTMPGHQNSMDGNTTSSGVFFFAKSQAGGCGCLPFLAHATVSHSTSGTSPFSPGATATFTCDLDFTFLGHTRKVTCDVTGAWTGLNGSCVWNSLPRFEISFTWTPGFCVEVAVPSVKSFTLEFTQGERRALTLGLTKTSNGTLLLAQFTYEIEIWDKGELIGQQLVTFTPGQEVNVTVVALETSAEVYIEGQSFLVPESPGLPFSSVERLSIEPLPLTQVSFRPL